MATPKKNRISADLAKALSGGAKKQATTEGDPAKTDPPNTDKPKKDDPPNTDDTSKDNAGDDTKTDANAGGEDEGKDELENAKKDLTAAQEKITAMSTELATLTASKTSQQGVIDHIQQQLTKATSDLATAQVKLEEAVKEAKAKDETIKGFREQVIHAVQRLGIACNTQFANLETLSDSNLIAQYKTSNSNFEKMYHVGGKAAATLDDEADTVAETTTATGKQAAAVRVTSLTKKR